MHSFIADDDVERMLARVDARGVILTWYVNTALRKALIGDGHNKGLKGIS